MSNGKKEAFIGVRVSGAAKQRIEAEAKQKGVSLNQHVVQILNGNLLSKGDAGVAVAQLQDHADDWEQLVDEVKHLTEKRDDLLTMIQKRRGIFSNAPQSLITAYRVCNDRIGTAADKLNKLFPRGKRTFWETLEGL